MGCGCGAKKAANTGAVKTTAAAAPKLYEVLDGARIVLRTRDEQAAKRRAESIPGGTWRPAQV